MLSVKRVLDLPDEDLGWYDARGRSLNKQSGHGSYDRASGHSRREGKSNAQWETDTDTMHFKTVIIM